MSALADSIVTSQQGTLLASWHYSTEASQLIKKMNKKGRFPDEVNKHRAQVQYEVDMSFASSLWDGLDAAAMFRAKATVSRLSGSFRRESFNLFY